MPDDRPVRPTPALADPPHLLTADGDGSGPAVTADAGAAVLDILVHGSWSQRLGEKVTAILRRCTAGAPAAILLDLRQLSDPYGVSMPFWLTAWRQARLQPAPVQLVFCLPATTALSRRLRTLHGPQPRVFATVPEARVAVAARMARIDRFQTALPPRPESARAARDLVRRACLAWRLPRLAPDAALVVSELAINAVQHAGTDFVVTVARNGGCLHLAVRDGASGFPHLTGPALTGPQAPLDERGRGLRLVHTIAAAWGALPARGGKVVWATVG